MIGIKSSRREIIWMRCRFFLLMIIASHISSALEEQLRDIVSGHIRSIFLPLHALGLANRLRIMSSVYNIARADQRELVVIWVPTEECASPFSELFANSNPYLTIVSLPLDHEHSQSSSRALFESWLKSVLVSEVQRSGSSLASVFFRDFVIDLSEWIDVDAILVWTMGTHTSSTMLCSDYLFAKSSFYRGLRPTSAVEGIMRGFLMSSIIWSQPYNIVGVHVRAFHISYDWPVVVPFVQNIVLNNNNETTTAIDLPPSLGETYSSVAVAVERPELFVTNKSLNNAGNDDDDGDRRGTKAKKNNKAIRFDEAAPLHSFIAAMREILISSPSIRFFVASNSADAKLELVRIFGAEKVVITPAKNTAGERSSLEGMQLAAAEFLLLSRTSFILHTTGSSFAKEAAAVHMRPLVDISYNKEKDMYIRVYNQDFSVPFCGIQEYARADTVLLMMQHTIRDEKTTTDSFVSQAHHNRDDYFNTKRSCYYEEGREMCTVELTMCLCPDSYIARTVGGLSNVFCNVDSGSTGSSRSYNNDSSCISILAESNGYTV